MNFPGLSRKEKNGPPPLGRRVGRGASVEQMFLHHAAHASTWWHWWHSRFLLRFLRHHRFSGKHKPCDGCSILKGSADNLCGVDDAGFHQILIFLRCCVEAEGTLAFFYLLQRDGTFDACVDGNSSKRLFQHAPDDVEDR